MRKIYSIFIILTLLVLSISFSFNANIQYIYGYNFSKDASVTFAGFDTKLLFEKEINDAYFRLSIDLEKLDLGKLNSEYKKYISKYANPFGIKISLPWFAYLLNEAYSDIYINDCTLRIGRFNLNNGSATFYSPSVMMASFDSLSPFEDNKTLPIDGLRFSGEIGNEGYDLYWTPITYDSIPIFLQYPTMISSSVVLSNQSYLSSIFTVNQIQAKNSIRDVQNLLKSYGLTDEEVELLINNPSLLSSYGFTDEQISSIKMANILLTLPSTYAISSTISKTEDIDTLNPKNSNLSVDLTGSFLNCDYRIAYTHDHYHFMVPKTIDVSYSLTGTGTELITFYRPIRDSLSLDIQGVSKFFDSISYHAEVSLIKPHRTYLNLFTDYFVPDTSNVSSVKPTTSSTKIEIFDDYYTKSVIGLEYTKGENFLLGLEVFNGLPWEELKNHISFGVDAYAKIKKGDLSIEGIGVFDVLRISSTYTKGIMGNIKLSYSGITGFEPSIKIQYTYAKSKSSPLYSVKKLNNITLSFKAYF